MADLKISELGSLAGADLVAADVVAVVDNSASETKKLTVSDLIANGVTLISDATIPSAKVLFSAGAVNAAALASSAVETAKINDSAVTAAKLADNSSVTLVSTLPGSGDFVGQVALDTDDSKIYVWSGSAWTSVKAAGSINVVNGSTSGLVNITATTSGDTVTISTTLDDTSAARQFLAGPTGAGGTVGYRAIIGTDLPTASSSAKGGVIVNGNGLAMSGDTLTVNNSVTAETTENHLVKYDANGLVTSGRVIASGDVPVATSSATGAVSPGTGLSVTGSGVLNHSNSLTAATGPKITFDAQGHVTGSTALVASDIPNLDAAKITTGSLASARIADDAITADKLADRSTATIAEVTPAGGAYIGQTHLNSITGDYFLWDGNVWQPIGISVGEIVLAGTYNATTNLLATVTTEGIAVGYSVGSALPAASSSNKGHYVIVSTAGTGTSPAPTIALEPPDFLLSTGTLYTEIDVSQTVTAQQASNIQFTPTGSIASNNVQTAITEVDTEKAPKASPTFSGTVSLDTAATIQFEGSSANDFETTLTVTDPTADRTITLPDVTGTVVTTGDTGSVTSTMIADGAIVNADINASAEIAVSKLANGTARQLLQTDAGGAGVEFTSNVDVPGTLDVTSAATFDSTVAVTGLLSANGKLAYPAGSAAAVSLYSGSDTDTGIYSPGSNQFGISTAGTSRIVVDSSGNVGIGTTSPQRLEHLSTSTDTQLRVESTSASSNNEAAVELIRGSNQSAIKNKAGGLEFFTGGLTSERLRIDSSGNVGIGTTSPLAFGPSLHVAGTDPAFILQDTATAVDFLGCNITSGAVTTWFDDAAHYAIGTASGVSGSSYSEKIRIDSSGNVGIGRNSPGEKLDILSTSGNCLIKMQAPAGSVSGFNAIGSNILAFQTGFSERMRIDSSGRLLVGRSTVRNAGNSSQSTRSPLYFIEGAGANAFAVFTGIIGRADSNGPNFVLAKTRSNSSGANTIVQNGDNLGRFTFAGADGVDLNSVGASIAAFVDGAPSENDMPGRLVFSTTADGASSPTERMRIDSDGGVIINNANNIGGIMNLKSRATTSFIFEFTHHSNNATVGSVITSTSSTAFNTNSDYRLKENVVNISDGITRVKQLAPKRFNFIADAETTVDGFLAHEAQTVVPEAVTGEHNAVKVWQEGEKLPDGVSVGDNKLDEDGNTIPDYQGIDQSKLVPLLTAALQEAITKIETLETKVAALEAG